MKKNNKVVLVGTGFVGTSYAYSLLNQSIVEELVLIDVNSEKAKGEVMDLNHGNFFMTTPTDVSFGDYSDCKDADIVCITAGVSQSEEETRLTVVEKNVGIVKNIVEEIIESGFDGIFLVATNPVDIISYATWHYSGFPIEKIIGSGTTLDTARYHYFLGNYFNTNLKSIEGYIVGEHGDSQVACLSSTKINNIPVFDLINSNDKYNMNALHDIALNTREAAMDIGELKGPTHHAIGLALARLTKAILKNENIVFPVSTLLNGAYGYDNVFASTPAIINRNGITRVFEVELDENERKKLNKSIDILIKTQDLVI